MLYFTPRLKEQYKVEDRAQRLKLSPWTETIANVRCSTRGVNKRIKNRPVQFDLS